MARSKSDSDPKLGMLIRRRRNQLGLTLQALCDRAGVSVGYLSQVERGHATPSLGTLAQIAQGLDADLNHFVGTPRPADALTRAGSRPQFSLDGVSMVYESLGAAFPGAELSCFLLHVPPGFVSETVRHEGEEIIFILKGEIVQTLNGQSFVLHEGDSLHYDGSIAHSWANRTEADARILWTGTLSVLQRKGALRLPEMSPANTDTENKGGTSPCR